MSGEPERFVLTTDGDSHWYVVPLDKLSDWEAWIESLDAENGEAPPKWARPTCGHPSRVTFTCPRIGQDEQ